MSQNHRRDPPAINPTKKSSLFEVPLSVSMIICSCNVLSDHEVRTAIATGAPPRTTGDLFRCLGCSAQCGRCARSIRRIMDEPPSPPLNTLRVVLTVFILGPSHTAVGERPLAARKPADANLSQAKSAGASAVDCKNSTGRRAGVDSTAGHGAMIWWTAPAPVEINATRPRRYRRAIIPPRP
jgi:bacterioferritin-associated ferredoxin